MSRAGLRVARFATALLIAAVLSAAAAAQPKAPAAAPRVDAKAGGSDAARQCALSGGLFQDANGLYRQTRSEPDTVAAMMRAHGASLAPADRTRLQSIVETVTAMAAGLSELDHDSAALAYARMCMSRAQAPGTAPSGAAVGRQYESALACGRKARAGSLERKECVAAAFAGRR